MNPEGHHYQLRPRPAEDVTLSIPIDTLTALKQIAAERDTSVNALLKFYIGQNLRQDLAKQFTQNTETRTEPHSIQPSIKSPIDCENLSDIRAEIDRLDRQVIALLGERFAYVKAAAKFKTSETSVKAPDRLQAMLQQRRVWAEAEGLNADTIENLYRDLVAHFIAEEMKHWQSKD